MHVTISTATEASTWYGEIKGWQAVIGSLLGFGALVAGALYNFRLGRKRDRLLRDEEALSVISALRGEILLLRRQCAQIARIVAKRHDDHGLGRLSASEPFDRHFIDMLKLPESTLYKALAAKVGLLPADLALELVSFYADVEEVRVWLPMLLDDKERGYSYSVLVVLRPALDAVRKIEPALRRINAMAGVPDDHGDPDVARAEQVRNEEIEAFKEAGAARTGRKKES